MKTNFVENFFWTICICLTGAIIAGSIISCSGGDELPEGVYEVIDDPIASVGSIEQAQIGEHDCPTPVPISPGWECVSTCYIGHPFTLTEPNDCGPAVVNEPILNGLVVVLAGKKFRGKDQASVYSVTLNYCPQQAYDATRCSRVDPYDNPGPWVWVTCRAVDMNVR